MIGNVMRYLNEKIQERFTGKITIHFLHGVIKKVTKEDKVNME